MIHAGQGTYFNGGFYADFPDHQIFYSHVLETFRLMKHDNVFQYDLCIPSGADTKLDTPDISEANSFLKILTEKKLHEGFNYELDELALDSAENLIFGLMAARVRLINDNQANMPIGKIGFSCAFKFKAWRLNTNAKSLGILPFFYFHGYSSETTFPVPDNYKKPSPSIVNDEKYLLRSRICLLYTSPSPRDRTRSRMPSSA